MIVIQILTGLILGFGFVLLIIPGLYLVGRLALVSPAVADQGLYNPLDAIGTSWNLTRDNGWSIFLFLFLVMLVVGITVGIVTLAVSAIVGSEPGAGRIVSGFFESGLGVAASMISIAISAAAYRQLASGAPPGVFD